MTVYSAGALGLATALAACNPGNGPQTGPGLEPPGSGSTVANPVMTMKPGAMNSGGFGNPNGVSNGPGSNPAMPAAGTGGTGPTTGMMTPGGSAGMGGSNPADGGNMGGDMMTDGTGAPSTGCTTVSADLGLHLLVDASFGMVVPRDMLQPLGAALDAWSASDTMATTQIGAQLFAGECSADAYATTSVPIGDATQLAAALDAQMSAGAQGFGAATAVALGAVSAQAQQWNESTHGNAALLLISGSTPTACDGVDGAAEAATAASDALALPQAVPTYVLAMRPMASLDSIAAAGGTSAARTVDDPTSSTALVDAMNAIADEARCRVALPKGASSISLVSDGVSAPITQVAGPDACGEAEGWYYYDADTHRFAVLCPKTCDAVRGGDDIAIVTCG